MVESRRDFLSAAAATAVVGTWHEPAWGGAPVRVLPANRVPMILENEWIPVADGTRLAVRVFLPEDAVRHPVGAILDYHAYRRRTSPMRQQDEAVGAWLVPRGFALVRVDVRGSGESDGVVTNEYDRAEQADVPAILDWIGSQPWCTGRVGMRGLSYGAITALQAAARGLRRLTAILTAAGTENGYLDDVHMLGGCVLLDKLSWGTIWRGIMAQPPDPQVVGERWRDMWQQRLEAQRPLVAEWHRHLLLDDYWRERVLLDYRRIRCPVYVTAGVTDAYTSSVPRLLERLRCPRKGLVGPWGHSYPHRGAPGPLLDWPVEEIRWWDRWLNGNDNGIMSEPMLRSYMAYGSPAQSYPADTPGRWVAEQTWPTRKVRRRRLHPAPGGVLGNATGAPEALPISRAATVGLCTPTLSPGDISAEVAVEQSPDDALATAFETEPLVEDWELLGNPQLHVTVIADQPVVKLVARLNEVTPDGHAWPVCVGALNLAHDASHFELVPLEAGVPRRATLTLAYVSRRLRRGSRLRLALSQSLWPILWPAPATSQLSIVSGSTWLDLPLRAAPAREAPMSMALQPSRPRAPPEPRAPRPAASGPLERRTVRWDREVPAKPLELEAIQLRIWEGRRVSMELIEGDPTTARAAVHSRRGMSRPGWVVEVVATTQVASTSTEFLIDESLQGTYQGETVFHRQWSHKVPRNGN